MTSKIKIMQYKKYFNETHVGFVGERYEDRCSQLKNNKRDLFPILGGIKTIYYGRPKIAYTEIKQIRPRGL